MKICGFKIMRLSEYQEKIIETEHWPKDIGPIYPALGLAGEAGEVANEIKKVYRDDGNFAFRINSIASEMGDVLWYLASLANSLGISLDDCLELSLNKVLNKTWERNNYHPNAFHHFEINYNHKDWVIEYYKFVDPDEINNTRENIEGTLIVDKSKDKNNAYFATFINNKYLTSHDEIKRYICKNYDKFQWWDI